MAFDGTGVSREFGDTARYDIVYLLGEKRRQWDPETGNYKIEFYYADGSSGGATTPLTAEDVQAMREKGVLQDKKSIMYANKISALAIVNPNDIEVSGGFSKRRSITTGGPTVPVPR